jgi:RNA polymerase sigma factor (sigma-70 family)
MTVLEGGLWQMPEDSWLAEQFETHRGHLRSVAYRMLGSTSEVDDAVQESWMRLARSEPGDVENLRGWLTTVVARVCLNKLSSRSSRREEPIDGQVAEAVGNLEAGVDPEREALVADSVGLALLMVLETLTPAERLAFVLHDMFAVPFDEIAPIVERSPTAARKLASRARRRVHGRATVPDTDQARQRELVEAFLLASRSGEFEALLAVLDPNIVLRADYEAVQLGAKREVRGSAAVARTFCGRAQGARLALINGVPGAVWAPGGRPRVVFGFTVRDRRIVGLGMLANPNELRRLDLVYLDR